MKEYKWLFNVNSSKAIVCAVYAHRQTNPTLLVKEHHVLFQGSGFTL